MRRWTTNIFFVAVTASWLTLQADAAYLRNVPVRLVQPGGDTLRCFASGDEYYNWLHDAAGYTIVRNPRTGYFEYATLAGGNVVPSGVIAGRADPAAAGLLPNAIASPALREGLRKDALNRRAPRRAPTTGTMQNLVVFVRFSDQPEFTGSVSTFDDLFNSSATSLMAYYREASYGQLTIMSTFYPAITAGGGIISYQDMHAQSYFMPYDATANPSGYTSGARFGREDSLLLRVVNAVAGIVPGSLDIDADGDGVIDNICFVVAGGSSAWGTLLWPHHGTLPGGTMNGKTTGSYDFEMMDLLTSQGSSLLCHEMGHSLGAPDLYHYSFNGMEPVGAWDLMAYNESPPQHMGAYMKYRYGHWIASIPEITSSGTYSLGALDATTDCCCMIRPSGSSSEYYVIEYRRREGHFDASLPGDGLLVYRINTAADSAGNAGGPPDEVYIYRPGGTPTANGNYLLAALSAGSGRTALDAGTDPSPFLSDGSQGGLEISGVGSAGSTISFTIGGPLPITLSSLTADLAGDGTVTLRWRTLSEIGNYGFTVQRQSGLDTAFSDIPGSFIPGNGTTTSPRDYAWSDTTRPAPPLRYRLRQINLDGSFHLTDPVAISAPGGSVKPTGFSLSRNYPNPFNPSTSLLFSVEKAGRATLTVFNALGQNVATLFDAVAVPGTSYRASFSGSGLASGVYFCTLASGGRIATTRMLLVK